MLYGIDRTFTVQENIQMPREGYVSITISDALKIKLEKVADKIEKSIPETIEFLVNNCKEV
jgi:hypothetical protein